MTIVDQAFDKDFDNVNDINQSIEDLYKIYISPIDAIRSKSLPNLSDPKSKDIETDPNIPLESKVHAFYRMLGFPVVSPSGKYYNPGYNPYGGSFLTAKHRQEVDDEYYSKSKIYNNIYEREKRLNNLLSIFKNPDSNIENTSFCLSIKYFNSINCLEETMEPLESYKQSKKNQDRINYFEKFFIFNDEETYDILTQLAQKYSEIPHQLHPFITDPRICKNVAPDTNLICIPFLPNKSATAIKKNTFLNRPGLEMIIRMRLEDDLVDTSFIKNIKNILEKSTDNLANSTGVLGSNILSNLVLFGTTLKLPKDVEDQLSNVSDLQFRMATKLMKILKTCINKLQEASNVIDSVENTVNWVPVVGGSGPIDGPIVNYMNTSIKNTQLEIDNKIKELELKKLNAEFSNKDFSVLGTFASPFITNTFAEDVSSYNDRISELQNSKKATEMRGFKSLKDIEIISGITSGLGLIDVISIYLALWTIDLQVLLAFLDADAFSRLLSEQDGKYASSPVVQKQNNSPITILDALKEFKNKLYNILEFSDIYLRNNQQNSPNFVNDSFVG
jgi:hypothetical protein